eukprot:g1073.t1
MVVDNVQDDNNFFLMGEDGSNREVWIPAVMLPHRLTISTVLPCLEQAPDQAEAVLWELQRSLVDLQLEQPERGQPEQPVSPSNDPSSSAHSSSDNPSASSPHSSEEVQPSTPCEETKDSATETSAESERTANGSDKMHNTAALSADEDPLLAGTTNPDLGGLTKVRNAEC